MKKTHRSLPIGSCLLTELLEELRCHGDFSNYNIVIPTQRLALYITRALAEQSGGKTVLPRLWTWERFVDEALLEYQNSNMVMVSSQCELIVEHVLSQMEGSSTRPLHTNKRHAHELSHLFAELARGGSHGNAKARLLKYLENDWRRSEEAFAILSTRAADVFQALTGFEETLAKHQWTTKELSRTRAISDWLNASPEEQSKSLPRGKLLIAGLTSLPPIEISLLKALSNKNEVSIWLDDCLT